MFDFDDGAISFLWFSVCGLFLLMFFNSSYDRPMHAVLTDLILVQAVFQC